MGAHCDAEAVHAAAVENIGHGHLKKDECKKHETGTGGKWVKGANGATCDATCKARGKTCDVSELNKLTSNAKVGAAFKQAGYTCKGYHAPRDYAGTPFSTARSDDCAPVIAGRTVTCSSNTHGHHAALCYCKAAKAASSYTLIGSGHCVDNNNKRPGHCYTTSISTESSCKSACDAVTGCAAYEWGQTGNYCQLIWTSGLTSNGNKQHSPVAGSCDSAVHKNWKYNLNADGGKTITKTHHNTGGKCYKKSAGGEWVKGANGKTCDATCAAKGKTCDVSELNKLTSNAKVGAAFKQAGYTCKGYHAARDYGGTPFSTARSDDCAPVIAGRTVTCSTNTHGHHAALCYCKAAKAASSYTLIGSGHCVDNSNKR